MYKHNTLLHTYTYNIYYYNKTKREKKIYPKTYQTNTYIILYNRTNNII